MRILVADRLPDRFVKAMERRGHECRVDVDLTEESLPASVAAVDILVVRSTRVSAVVVAEADALQPGILLNTSRAEVVDTEALIARLDAGVLSAGLDVFPDEPAAGTAEWHSPLASHPRVVSTHHVGASTQQAQEAVVDGVVEVVCAYDRGKLLNVVNAAARSGQQEAESRLTR
jgi:D-3-phosphoglycerate dehydrogenase